MESGKENGQLMLKISELPSGLSGKSIKNFFFLLALQFVLVSAIQQHESVDSGHSDWYEVTHHCSFDLHFSNNE